MHAWVMLGDYIADLGLFRQAGQAAILFLKAMMDEGLTNKIIAWATEVARHAATLPSRQARDSYLAERRDELIAGAVAQGTSASDAAVLAEACMSAAQRIMTELMVQRGGEPQGRA